MSRRRAPSGFSLLELLATIGVIGILAALAVSSASSGMAAAKRVTCVSSLRQLGFAAQLYWDDNDQRLFPYSGERSRGGRAYWFGWIGGGAEGERAFEPEQGALWPYLQGRGVEICPAFDYGSALYKRKARGASHGYGYNLHLSELARAENGKADRVARPSDAALFADAAQINDFQAPASPQRPLLEEFYYVNDGPALYANGHFRHVGRANAAFMDGHVAWETPAPGSIDLRLPSLRVGRLRKDILLLP